MESLYADVIKALRTSAALEKHASTDEELSQKTAHDWHLFQQMKNAAVGRLAKQVLSNPVGRGLAYGAGAALPVGALGTYLIGRAGQEERDTIADLRNKALQVALGVGALGAGLYGMHRAAQTPTPQSKYGSAPDVDITTPVEKLATTALLDELLAEHPQNEKIAELRLLNAEHGIDILRQLLD